MFSFINFAIMKLNNFDDIRSFRDNEVNHYLKIVVKDPLFLEILAYQFGKENLSWWLESISKINTIKELQTTLLKPLLENLLQKSVSELTYSGLEYLDKNESYLFISNHRDILLDSFILNYIFFINGFETIESAIGNNLLVMPWIEYLARLNKTFIVQRNLEGKKFYYASHKLSQYINDCLLNRNQSIWIAQQEGRSKDGNDITQSSLIRMILLAADKGKEIELLNKYKIIPVSLSYEYDPCVIYKIIDNYLHSHGKTFDKSDEFRLNEMKEGLIEYKGNVHFSISKPLSFKKNNQNLKDLIKLVTSQIDKEIHENYIIYPFHWYCYDKVNNSSENIEKYYGKENEFENYINNQINKLKIFTKNELDNVDAMILCIFKFYAQIVENYLKACSFSL